MNEGIIQQAEKILAGLTKFEHGCLECCVLAQLDAEGYPTAATISPVEIEGIKRVWFCSGAGSNWVKRAEADSRASICFNSEDKQYNITLIGTVEVVTDPAVKKKMWFDGMGYYFSGPEDSGFCVLQFTTLRYSLMLNEHDVNGSAKGSL